MTVTDALKVVVTDLSNIAVPAGLVNQIGIPIAQSIRNLQECIKAIDKVEVKDDGEQSDSCGRDGTEC